MNLTQENKLNQRIWLLIIMVLSTLTYTSCEDEDNPADQDQDDILAFVQNDPRLTTLAEALQTGNLIQTLEGNGPFTLFAPTNDAFETFLEDNDLNSVNDIEGITLTRTLLHHMVQDRLTSGQVIDGYIPTLLIGFSTTNSVNMYVDSRAIAYLNLNANIIEPDNEVSNGIVHIVDGVIPIPTVIDHVSYSDNFTIFIEALSRTDMAINFIDTLSSEGPFTLFAPNNEAFDQFFNSNNNLNLIEDIPADTLQKILSYHIIPGRNILSTNLDMLQSYETLATDKPIIDIQPDGSGGLLIEDEQNRVTNVIAVNIQGFNGVVHAINRVLLPELR